MPGNPSIDNLHPIFLQQLMAFVAASGGRVRFGSGWRSFQQQAQLYADYKAGKPGQARAAAPGRSNHNFGLAMDLTYGPGGQAWAAANAARFGLRFPMDDEPWHIEPIALAQMKGNAVTSMVDFGYQTVSPEQARDRAKQLYGYLGWYVDHPEIGPILVKAGMQGWDAARLQGALSKTKWWKTTSESARQWDALLVSDNATAARRINETSLSVRLKAEQLGIPIDKQRVYTMSVEALRLGWNPDELQLAIAAEMRFNPKMPHLGATGKVMGDVRKMGDDYLVPINDRQAFDWTRRIVGGAADMSAVEARMRLLAAARFPHLAKQIGQGVTPGQFFTPVRNYIAETLETSPDKIDLLSPEWAPVTTFQDRKTGAIRPMTFAEAQRYARTRPGWSSTANAWDTATDIGNTIMETFGAVA